MIQHTRATAGVVRWPLDARPRIVTAGCFPLADRDFVVTYRGPTHALHLHDYHGTIDLDGCVLPLTPGMVTLSPANRPSRYDLPAPGRHWCIHFEPASARRPHASIPRHLGLGAERGFVADRMSRIARLWSHGRPNPAAAARAVLQELLLQLAIWHEESAADDARPSNRHADRAVDALIDLVHQRLDQPLTVPDLAHEVQLSQNYLARQFKRRTGQTIPRFILQARIDRARLLLSTTDLPIKAVAIQVGLADPQHFNKQFRRVVGVSPTAYRNQGGGIWK